MLFFFRDLRPCDYCVVESCICLAAVPVLGVGDVCLQSPLIDGMLCSQRDAPENEGNEGNEGDEGNEGNEGNEGDEGTEGTASGDNDY